MQGKIKLDDLHSSLQDTIGGSNTYMSGAYDVKSYGAVGDGVTDDTAAINAAIVECANHGSGVVFFPQAEYEAGNIITPDSDVADWRTIELRGETAPPATFGTIGSFTFNNYGTIIRSTATTGAAIAVPIHPTEVVSSLELIVKNLEVRTPSNPSINGINTYYARAARFDEVYVNTGVYSPMVTTYSNNVAGIIMPGPDNNCVNVLRNVIVTGLKDGIIAYEHCSGHDLQIDGCQNGLVMAGAIYHASYFGRVCIQDCYIDVDVRGAHEFTIAQLDSERSGDQIYNLQDAGNLGRGEITYHIVQGGGVGIVRTFLRNGGVNVLCKPQGGLPEWTTANRPTSNINSYIGKNLTTNKVEASFNGSAWVDVT